MGKDKIVIIGAGPLGTTIARHLQSEGVKAEAVQHIPNPAFEPEPLTITASPFVKAKELDPIVYMKPRSKYHK